MQKPSRLSLALRVAVSASLVLFSACKDSNGETSSKAAAPVQDAQTKPQVAVAGPAPVAPVQEAAVARLGQVQVGADELALQLKGITSAQYQLLQQNRGSLEQWLRERLAEKALYEQALNQGWDDKPEIRQSVEQARRQLIVQSYLQSVSQPPESYPSDAELTQTYERNQAALQVPARYRIEQLFLPFTGQSDSDGKLKAQADEIVQKIRKSGNFAAVAQDLEKQAPGQVSRSETPLLPLEQLLPETRAAIAQLKTGQISEPVRSASGWHVLHLLHGEPARAATLDEVRGQLVRLMREQRQQDIAFSYLNGLLDTGTVTIDGGELSKVLERSAPEGTLATQVQPDAKP